MTYRIDTMIPVKVGLLSIRTMSFTLDGNDRLMIKRLDFLEENKDIASICLADYQ